MSRFADQFNFNSEEVKENNNVKLNLNKYEYDLYHDDDNIPGKVIQVKRMGNLKKGEKWKILKDNKAILTIDGSKLTSKERSFLYTLEGVSFLINQFKNGEPTIACLKKQIKTILNSKVDSKL